MNLDLGSVEVYSVASFLATSSTSAGTIAGVGAADSARAGSNGEYHWLVFEVVGRRTAADIAEGWATVDRLRSA